MIIRMNSVKKVNVSVRQIVTTVFLIQGQLRSDYKSRRSNETLQILNMEQIYQSMS